MAKKIAEKMCLKCREIKPVTEFYANRGWSQQLFCDTVCKDCAHDIVVDKDSARRYCWENNRVWNDAMWETAKKRAASSLATNQEYLSKKTKQARKNEIELAMTAAQFFGVFNMNVYYQFVENETEEGRMPYNPESLAGTTLETAMTRADEEQVWSDEWGGMYTKRELRYLDGYMDRLRDEFVLDNVNREDYARRVALASLDANNKFQKMRQGTGTAKEWQDAQNVFDAMSKSASFAESQRKEVVNSKLTALDLIIMDIELNHHNELPKVTFEKDDIDKILHDFGFTGEAIS